MTETASKRASNFAQSPLNQPQSWEEGSVGSNCVDGIDNGDGTNDWRKPGAAEGLTFEVVEDNAVGDGQDDDFGDGFKLLTQSNELFKKSSMNGGHASSGGSSDDNSSSSSSSSSSGDDESDSGSSTEEVSGNVTPLQERRERNVLRNNAYIENIKQGLSAMMNGYQAGTTQDSHSCRQKKKVVTEQTGCSSIAENDVNVKEEIFGKKRRGMIFSTVTSKKRRRSPSNALSFPQEDLRCTANFIAELKLKYPHRSQQIHLLFSQLVTIVQKSKFAWQMSDNLRSSGIMQCSEASYQGDVKLAASAPIMVTGAGGNGKTCIVRDALEILQRGACRGATSSTVAVAYIDCASTDSGSVASVMHSAYRQLYECFHPSCGFGQDGKVRLKGNEKLGEKVIQISGKAQSTLAGDDSAEEYENDIADEDSIEEDLLEQQRNRKWGKGGAGLGKKTKNELKNSKSTAHNNNQKNARQTRLRNNLASEAANETVHNSPSLKGSIQNTTNRITQSSAAVALFGRATSALIQGDSSKKKTPESWRCTFLILDNADRILSWKKHGSVSPLTALFLLPSVFGINLTLIFISRSTIFQYSRELLFSRLSNDDRCLPFANCFWAKCVVFSSSAVHHRPGTMLDAIHPVTIHFDSYTSVEMIKTILNVPHVQRQIIGRPFCNSHMFLCNHAKSLRSKMNDILYSSMMNSFVPSVISTTHDMTEIIRLARLLWPEYSTPLENSGDPILAEMMWKILGCLSGDGFALSNHDSNCTFCQFLPSKTGKSMDLNMLKQLLSEKLDTNIRESLRGLLSSTIMMPGRVLPTKNNNPYAGRLPYITKFLLLAAFLCQNKRKELDANLFTTENTGKSKRRRTNKSEDGSAYAASSKDLTQRQPSFPLERMLSVFASIIGQYGHRHYMSYKEVGVSTVAQLGTTHLFRSISQLIATGLLRNNGRAKFDEKYDHDLIETMSAKFSCTVGRGDAKVVATSVGFPLEKYCP